MLSVVGNLLVAPALRLVQRLSHRLGDRVGIHDDVALDVARCPADDLDERPVGAQVALFVRIQDADERDLRQVETLPQQVDADHDVNLAGAQRGQDFDALHRVELGVQVSNLDSVFPEVVGEVLREALGQRGDEGALAQLRALLDLGQQVVDLSFGGTHLHRRIDQPGRPHEHLRRALRAPHLIRPGGGGDIDHVARALLPLLKAQRPVVERAGQAEAVLDQGGLARAVAAEHAADLRHGDVGLVDEDDRVVGQEIHQRVRRLAGLAPGQVQRIVLDPGARTGLAQHL